MACVGETDELGVISSSATVADQAVAGGCSTAVVIGLARQIADEVSCALPGQFVEFDAPNIVLSSNAVLPYLQADAVADLMTIASGTTVRVNSAFRTPPQQYLLYQWMLAGKCSITAAATVGRSNHESGRALDISGYSLSAMTQNDWSHNVPGDDPHFDHADSLDLRGEDIRAFQRLWNRNHPEDAIEEDGLYGPITEARLRNAPAIGFPIGASCGAPPPAGQRALEVVSISGADRAPPSTRIHYRLAISNLGDTDWSVDTRLIVADGSSSLRAPSWRSDSEVAIVGPVAAGELAWLEFDIVTPAATSDVVIVEKLSLSDGGTVFGDIQLALTVVADATEPSSGDGSEPVDENGEPLYGETTGGCSAGGTPGWLGVVLALWLWRRRFLAP